MSWTMSRVAPDGTHHTVDGTPLYAERFDSVLSYHAPGLAPVQRGGEGWHVDAHGRAAYARRFRRAFGFYEGLAAVVSDDGWHHVLLDGRDAYPARHAWCGNVQQSRCAVRDEDGHYRHIDTAGRAVGDRTWRYAGDFRDGIAVVQADDGLSTHVGLDGKILHGRWFQDLDVFHKGFARARDERGWTHVDAHGVPVYGRRFAMVEPFYNCQARIERFDGGLEIIDPRGVSLLELRSARRSEFASLSGDLVGFWRTQTIHAAVVLGVFDALPGPAAEIAWRCAIPEDRLTRLLRALGELGLVELETGRWSLTGRAAPMRSDHPLTLADAAKEYATWLSDSWRHLPDALRERGDDGSAWSPPDVFGDAAEERRAPGFHRMLASYARHDYPPVPAALGLRGDERVIEAAGGSGVLAEMLLRAYPALRVLLLERPEVVPRAGVAPELAPRFEARSFDLFAPWESRGDAVVLARVLHDWDDQGALRILRRARESVPRGGRVFVVEMVVNDDGFSGALCDLHLLTVTGGRERSASQYAALLDAAGFAPQELRRIPSLVSIVPGVAR